MKHFVIILFCGTSLYLNAQNYIFQGLSPFGLKEFQTGDQKATLKLFFTDLDADGDLDVLHMGISSIDDVEIPVEENIHWFLDMQMNTGSKKNAVFGPRQPYANNFPFPNGYFVPAIGDLNHDGNLDMIVSSQIDEYEIQEIIYYHNSGSSLNPVYQFFTAKDLDVESFVQGSFFLPELVDLDVDGDLDLLVSGYEREYMITEDDTIYGEVYTFKYAKNIGSQTSPEFLGWFTEPYNLKTHGIGEMFLTAGDIDLDGDVDILGRGSNLDDLIPNLYFYENVPGSNGKPFFLFPWIAPFGLPSSGAEDNLLFPTLVDIDGDTDLDLFIVRYDGDILYELEYYENDLASSTESLTEDDIITIRPQPVQDQLIIDNHSGKLIHSVEILDISGKAVMFVESPELTINVNNLPNGTYVLRIMVENTFVNRYFLKTGRD